MDAEMLLHHVMRKDRAWLLTHLEDKLSDSDVARYLETVERRYRGEPIQYITGEAEFFGMPFRVTPDVLIPRPETEHLVERILTYSNAQISMRICDVGAGSGAIAVALAHQLPRAEVTAIDVSAAALALAAQNAELNGVGPRIRFLQGDLLAPVAGERFDIIVSNPPYVPESDRASLAAEVRDHEPALALFAGLDGLDVYRRLIPAAFDALLPGGMVALEIGYGQQQEVARLLREFGFYRIEFLPDLQGIPRVASAFCP